MGFSEKDNKEEGQGNLSVIQYIARTFPTLEEIRKERFQFMHIAGRTYQEWSAMTWYQRMDYVIRLNNYAKEQEENSNKENRMQHGGLGMRNGR